ncbi:MAG: AMP-binding protein [Betaproteobacteria bacterium]|nr:AMP-binding protein [Betaproteobacteria bacterium]
MRHDRFVWEPTPELLSHTTITAFLREHGLPDYQALLARADAGPEWLWGAVLRFFGVRFYRPYERILDTSAGIESPRWCVGGETNLVLNCLDRHRGTPTWSRPAVIWEGERGELRRWNYAELDAATSRLSAGLRSLGLGGGDVIALYMPMLPETCAAFLAIAKIGAIAMPLFSGFGPQPIADRLNDGEAKAVITVDFAWRRGKRIAMKETLDHAAAEAAALRHVVVLERGGGDAPMRPGCDLWWAELIRAQPPDSPTEAMPAEAPVMLMYTSGTTGKARGTECGGAILIGSFHRPLKPSAFGSAVPGSGADVVDLEGRPCAPGEVGELVLRKPSIGLTRGLWRDLAGYLESYWRQIPGVRVQGDLARRDEDGLWYMLGRSDDTIKIAGKRTGPSEIETVLLASGMVAEAAAVGVPDPITGSALVCVCVPAMDANDEDRLRSTLAERIAERFGPPYRPRRVLLVPELPKTRNEKIMRRLVRAVLTGNAPGDTGSLMNPEAVEALRAAVHRAP